MLVAVPSQQLKCPKDPASALREIEEVFQTWSSRTWDSQFKALDLTRSLMIHQPHTVVPVVEPAVDGMILASTSLRSCLARNGLLCLSDFYSCLADINFLASSHASKRGDLVSYRLGDVLTLLLAVVGAGKEV